MEAERGSVKIGPGSQSPWPEHGYVVYVRPEDVDKNQFEVPYVRINQIRLTSIDRPCATLTAVVIPSGYDDLSLTDQLVRQAIADADLQQIKLERQVELTHKTPQEAKDIFAQWRKFGFRRQTGHTYNMVRGPRPLEVELPVAPAEITESEYDGVNL